MIAVAVVQVQLSYLQLQPRGYITKETMDIDWRDWRYSKEAQKSAFIENGYFPASLAEPLPDIARWTVTDGVADVTASSLKGHDLELDVMAELATTVRVNSPDFSRMDRHSRRPPRADRRRRRIPLCDDPARPASRPGRFHEYAGEELGERHHPVERRDAPYPCRRLAAARLSQKGAPLVRGRV